MDYTPTPVPSHDTHDGPEGCTLDVNDGSVRMYDEQDEVYPSDPDED